MKLSHKKNKKTSRPVSGLNIKLKQKMQRRYNQDVYVAKFKNNELGISVRGII